MHFIDTITRYFDRNFRRFLTKRIPATNEQLLNMRSLFVIPSKAGAGFIVLIFLCWLMATNFTNNLVHIFTYFLLSLMIIVMHRSHGNLSGVKVRALKVQPAFEGESLWIDIQLRTDKPIPRKGIQLGWPGEVQELVDLNEQGRALVKLPVLAGQRGYFCPGRLKITTYYPLGLFRVWSWVQLDIQALVYPKPIFQGKPPAVDAQGEAQAQGPTVKGGEDFSHLDDYHPGDNLRQVAWKQFAQGKGLKVKRYESHQDARVWLDWDSLPGLPLEPRLSRLAGWAVSAFREQQAYGLRLPGIEIQPNHGDAHQQQVLRALALFDMHPSSKSLHADVTS